MVALYRAIAEGVKNNDRAGLEAHGRPW